MYKTTSNTRQTSLFVRIRLIWVAVFFPLVFSISCGDNLYESLEEPDVATEATLALEDGNPTKAVTLCLDELGSSYKSLYNSFDADASSVEKAQLQANLEASLTTAAASNADARNIASILSSALAQRAGVDMIDVALNLATTGASSSTATDNPITTLGSAINDNPTASVLSDMELALMVLRSIGVANYRSGESFKDSIFQMAHLALFTSALGDLSSVEITDALEILDFIENALATSSGASSEDSEQAQESLAQIQQIYDDIGVTASDSDAVKQQKVQDFLNGAQ